MALIELKSHFLKVLIQSSQPQFSYEMWNVCANCIFIKLCNCYMNFHYAHNQDVLLISIEIIQIFFLNEANLSDDGGKLSQCYFSSY